MKKALLLCLVMSFTAFATPKDELTARLSKTEGFTATFSQKVISPENEIIMEGSGNVEIARPSLFRWTTLEPDENILVSDGETLWYYNPFVDQVSIYRQEQATEQTPFVLLTRNRPSDWDKYLVAQAGNQFTLTPTAIDSNQGRVQLEIDEDGTIEGFNVIEQDGQQSQFTFENFKTDVSDKARFTFTVPEGVEVDDQR